MNFEDKEGQLMMFFTREDMQANGWFCARIGFVFGLFAGAIVTWLGLLSLASLLGIE